MNPDLKRLKRVQIIDHYQIKDAFAFDRFTAFLKMTADSPAFGKKQSNYLLENFDILNHLTYDLLIDPSNDEIVSGAGIYNGGRFPNGVWRILNRSFIAPKYRSSFLFSALNTHLLLPIQIAENLSQLKIFFVSREGKNGLHGLNWWLKKHASIALPNLTWSVPVDFIQIKPNVFSKNVFQHIAVSGPEANNKQIWEPQKLSVEEWYKLP